MESTEWVDLIEEALRRLGGKADLRRIYEKTDDVWRERNDGKPPESFEETIRDAIQRHCRDSPRKFKSDERFVRVRRGRYRLTDELLKKH